MAKKVGTCQCSFGGLRQDYASGDMEMVFKVFPNSKQSARLISDKAKDIEKLTVSIEKYTNRRSLDANAYFWTLIGKLSALEGMPPPDEIYREYIQGIGDNYEIVPIRDDAKSRWIKNWQAKGLGWVCVEIGPSKHEGFTNIACYYGSSTYDSHQMYRLTEMLIFDCKEQGIETKTPEELARLCDEWAEKQTG